jgi:hypothetical protein
MAKIVQLKKENMDAYPRTLDQCVLVSGTTLLSTKISEIDGDINGFKDGTIPVGMSISAVTDSEGNVISTTYSTTDTTYQFEQSGNTLMVGEDNGTKTAVYTPSYGTLTVGEIETGTDTEPKFVSASVLKAAYNISGDTINIGGDSMTFGTISEAQIRALFQ